MKHKRKKRIIFTVLYTVFGLVFVTAAILLAVDLVGTHKANEEFKDLQNMYGSGDEEPTPGINKDPIAAGDITPLPDVDGEDDDQQAPSPSQPAEPAVKRNLAELVKKNKDCVGWIYQKGTKLNYPLMYTPSDPEKYLRRSFYGSTTTEGVPFIEARCSLTGGHLILYGHNMNNDTMFGSLKYYTKQSYYKNHPTFEVETTVGGVKQYKIFAACFVKIDDYVYSVTDFKNEEKYNKFVNHVKSKSFYDTGITPSYGQQIITLSTCYGKDKTNRLVVFAVNA